MSNPHSKPQGPATARVNPTADAGAHDAALECPLCGARLQEMQCKLLCANCGYREDCSDLFPVRNLGQPR